jgi:hypothetical protein
MIKKQLLCTFSDPKNYRQVSDSIFRFYNTIDNNRVFVFVNEKNSNKLFLTYSIVFDNKDTQNVFPNTISIHRKKGFNVLYTLNALNTLIRDENGGELDNKFVIQWKLYQNSLIMTADISIRIIPIKIQKVIKKYN